MGETKIVRAIKILNINRWLPTAGIKKEFWRRVFITFAWLAVITLLRWSWHWNLISLWLGALVGTFLLDIDHLLYVLAIYPHELTSMRVKRLIDQQQFKEALVLLVDTQGERMRLVFHNALFQPVFYVFCFFVLSSTGSLFGAGLVMAMALHLLEDEMGCLLKKREESLRKRLFWQIKAEVSLRNQKFFVILMLLVFLGLSLLLI